MRRMSIISLVAAFMLLGAGLTTTSAMDKEKGQLKISKEADYKKALNSFKAHVGESIKGAISTNPSTSSASSEGVFLKITPEEVTVVCAKGKQCEGPLEKAKLESDGKLKEQIGTIEIHKGSCYVCSGGNCYNYC